MEVLIEDTICMSHTGDAWDLHFMRSSKTHKGLAICRARQYHDLHFSVIQDPSLLLRLFVVRKVEPSDWLWTARDHGKGTDDGRSAVSHVVSFPPSFARTFSLRERRLGTRQSRPWVLVRPRESNPRPPALQSITLPTESGLLASSLLAALALERSRDLARGSQWRGSFDSRWLNFPSLTVDSY